MIHIHTRMSILGFIGAIAFSYASSQDSSSLRLKSVIPLPNVNGRIDHMDFDPQTGRLFVAALGNSTVEVVNLGGSEAPRTLKGFSGPQGILFLKGSNQVYVDNGGDGTCVVLDGASLARVSTLPGLDDADNIRYALTDGLVFAGYGNGGIAGIDPGKAEIRVRFSLPSHPESFQVDSREARIYVNLPGDRKIAVIDLARNQVTANWPLKSAGSNFPMALDEAHHRLFVGCRTPARLLVLDASSGGEVSSIPIGKDVDDVFYDPDRARVYASCGEGIVDVIVQQDPNTYRKIPGIATRKGARTSLFIPGSDLLILAVPREGDASAEIRIYTVSGR